MIKDVGRTVGSEAECTANELMVVVPVHGPDKIDKDEKTSAPDPGGGIPDALTSEPGDGAPDAPSIVGDNKPGGDDPDNKTTDHPAVEPKKENGTDSLNDKTVK